MYIRIQTSGHVLYRDPFNTAMHKVFDNGEILGLILGLLSRQICARLVTTSQNFLKQGAPHIWRKLDTPQPLLLLIPGAKKVIKPRNDSYTRNDNYIEVRTRDLLHMSRLNTATT